MCEKICTTVAAAQFGVYAVYVSATQHSLMIAEWKVERDQDGLHLIIPYRNKTSLGLVVSPTARLDSQ